MNREIKFRVWNPTFGMFPARTLQEMSSFNYNNGDGVKTLEVTWPPETIFMQFVGLKDRHDKEIYEGDIISWDYEYDSDYDGDMPIVKRSTGRAAIKDIFDRHQIFTARNEGKGCEVIGNIYEDPELLK